MGLGMPRTLTGSAVIDPNNSFHFTMLDGDKPVLKTATGGWGPNWSWFFLGSSEKATTDHSEHYLAAGHSWAEATISLNVKAGGPNRAVFDYALKAQQDVPILMIVASFGVPPGRPGQGPAHESGRLPTDHELAREPAEFGVVKTIQITSPAWNGPLEVALDSAAASRRRRRPADQIRPRRRSRRASAKGDLPDLPGRCVAAAEGPRTRGKTTLR